MAHDLGRRCLGGMGLFRPHCDPMIALGLKDSVHETWRPQPSAISPVLRGHEAPIQRNSSKSRHLWAVESQRSSPRLPWPNALKCARRISLMQPVLPESSAFKSIYISRKFLTTLRPILSMQPRKFTPIGAIKPPNGRPARCQIIIADRVMKGFGFLMTKQPNAPPWNEYMPQGCKARPASCSGEEIRVSGHDLKADCGIHGEPPRSRRAVRPRTKNSRMLGWRDGRKVFRSL